jgi:hypothetical protein
MPRAAAAMIRSHSERDQRLGPPEDRDYRDPPEIRAACDEIYKRNGYDDVAAQLSAIFEEITPLANAINAALFESQRSAHFHHQYREEDLDCWRVSP